MLYVLTILSIFISLPVFGNTYNEEALKLLQDSQQKILPFLTEAKELKEKFTKSLIETLEPKILEQKIDTCQRNISKTEHNSKEYLIFVSFSMPAETLKSLYREAEANGTTLILRGLKEQSFKKTGEYLQNIGIGVQIDPELFKKYQITKVPAFIWIRENEFHSINGNITFAYAKRKFLEHP